MEMENRRANMACGQSLEKATCLTIDLKNLCVCDFHQLTLETEILISHSFGTYAVKHFLCLSVLVVRLALIVVVSSAVY